MTSLTKTMNRFSEDPECVETYERNCLAVAIMQDIDPMSPRDDDGNLGTMICSHRKYNLGDEQFNSDDYEGWDDLADKLRSERGAVIILPLGLYDHSGITIYVGDTHDRWDGGQVGYIYLTEDDLKESGLDDIKATKALQIEVETYDQYLRGEVYGYVIQDADGEDIDSCWGFYDQEYCENEANDVADNYVHPHKVARKAQELHR